MNMMFADEMWIKWLQLYMWAALVLMQLGINFLCRVIRHLTGDNKGKYPKQPWGNAETINLQQSNKIQV